MQSDSIIIIPTYNRKDMLAEAIDSVLKQSLKDIEVIVIDDCSTDGTSDFVKSIPDERIRYFRNENNSGLEYNRNVGFRHSRGKYITFLDDDDYYTDYEFFEKAVKIHEEHEAAVDPLVMVYANARLVDTQTGKSWLWDLGNPGHVRGLDFVLGRENRKKAPSTFPAVFRAETLRRAGLENMVIFDTETYMQTALLGDAYLLPDVVGIYRHHKQSASLGYKNHPAQNQRISAKIKAMAERGVLIAEGIRVRSDKKIADKWCKWDAYLLLHCYRGQQSYINELRTHGRAMLIMSKFTPQILWRAPYWEAKRILRKITPLRKIYRFIKYRLRGRPYPED